MQKGFCKLAIYVFACLQEWISDSICVRESSFTFSRAYRICCLLMRFSSANSSIYLLIPARPDQCLLNLVTPHLPWLFSKSCSLSVPSFILSSLCGFHCKTASPSLFPSVHLSFPSHSLAYISLNCFLSLVPSLVFPGFSRHFSVYILRLISSLYFISSWFIF